MRSLAPGWSRRGSGNTAALRTVQALAPDGVTAEMYEGLTALPAFSPDEDEHPPGPVTCKQPNAPVLLWGDARIGNMIFAPGGTPLAVLDWETATFGQAEEDLAWYLFLDRHHSEGLEVPRLEGFPPPGETIAHYEELLGRPMQYMGYYEVLSGFKFTVIMSRIGQAMIDWGWLEPDSDFPHNNNCSRLVDVILEGLS